MADDSYKTIKQVAEGYYTEKRSRFISYAIPVRTVEEVKEQLEKYRKQYYDARHVCWAYMLGPERADRFIDCRSTLLWWNRVRNQRADRRLSHGRRRGYRRRRDRGTYGRRGHHGRFRIPIPERDHACRKRG